MILSVVKICIYDYCIFNKHVPSFVVMQPQKISICEDHISSRSQCSKKKCLSLHVCKFFLLTGECQAGQKCRFGHTVDDDHNQTVIAGKEFSTIQDLGKHFQKNRSSALVPHVCTHYNKGAESHCSKESKCSFLHICLYYLRGDCIFGAEKCSRYHGFSDGHTKKILQMYGIFNTEDEKFYQYFTNLLKKLSVIPRAPAEMRTAEQSRDAHAQQKTDRKHSQDSNMKQPSKSTNSRRTALRNEFDQLCLNHLESFCNNPNCKKLHRQQPYSWTYERCDQSHLTNKTVFSNKQSIKIEKAFCNPENDNVCITMDEFNDSGSSDKAVITFDNMMMTLVSHGTIPTHRVTRLSTCSSVTADTAAEEGNFATQWLWYTKRADTTEYKELGSEISAAIEKNYQSMKAISETGEMFEIDMNNMTVAGKSDYKARRRPFFKERIQSVELICLDHLRAADCSKEDCTQIHWDKPYKWEMLLNTDDRWVDIDKMEEVEKNFCDATKDELNHTLQDGSSMTINFDRMRCSKTGRTIRRLSTQSRAIFTAACNEPYTTEWLWYMNTDEGWIMFGDTSKKEVKDSPPSLAFEKQYQENRERRFSFDDCPYIVDFKQMTYTKKETESSQQLRRRPMHKSGMICIAYLEGSCDNGDHCADEHCFLPYQWMHKDAANTNGADANSVWQKCTRKANEYLEQHYCNYNIDRVTVALKGQVNDTVDFTTMRSTSGRTLKRMSTASSVFVTSSFATTWLWYWLNNQQQWRLYGSQGDHGKSDKASQNLEKIYIQAPDHPVRFSTDQFSYTIDMAAMVQTNTQTNVTRKIRRRPQPHLRDHYPATWKRPLPVKGFVLVKLDPVLNTSAQAYYEIQQLFNRTVNNRVTAIYSVQNPHLWDAFCVRKRKMISEIGASRVHERKLFHGTRADIKDDILQDGFDWRIAGSSSGTVYGRGSYFARDASYSVDYCRGSREMLVVRVLVGRYAQGNSSMVRPPPINASFPNVMYDSTVDNVGNPSIFVTYERDYAYPEYVIQFA